MFPILQTRYECNSNKSNVGCSPCTNNVAVKSCVLINLVECYSSFRLVSDLGQFFLKSLLSQEIKIN